MSDFIQQIVDWLYALSPLGLAATLLLVWWITGPRAGRYVRTVHMLAQYVGVGWLAVYGFMLWGG